MGILHISDTHLQQIFQSLPDRSIGYLLMSCKGFTVCDKKFWMVRGSTDGLASYILSRKIGYKGVLYILISRHGKPQLSTHFCHLRLGSADHMFTRGVSHTKVSLHTAHENKISMLDRYNKIGADAKTALFVSSNELWNMKNNCDIEYMSASKKKVNPCYSVRGKSGTIKQCVKENIGSEAYYNILPIFPDFLNKTDCRIWVTFDKNDTPNWRSGQRIGDYGRFSLVGQKLI